MIDGDPAIACLRLRIRGGFHLRLGILRACRAQPLAFDRNAVERIHLILAIYERHSPLLKLADVIRSRWTVVSARSQACWTWSLGPVCF